MGVWRVDDLPAHILITPSDDIIIHTRTQDCPCGPTVKEVSGQCCLNVMYVRKVITHNAMDGRKG